MWTAVVAGRPATGRPTTVPRITDAILTIWAGSSGPDGIGEARPQATHSAVRTTAAPSHRRAKAGRVPLRVTEAEASHGGAPLWPRRAPRRRASRSPRRGRQSG